MRKWSLLLLTVVLAVVLSACGQKAENNAGSSATNNGTQGSGEAGQPNEVTVKVGATTTPHAEILKVVQPILKKEGVNLEIVEFNDYIQPNTQLYEKLLDANYFQHTPYLEQFNKDKGYDLVNVAGVHIEPFGAYSKKVKNSADLPQAAKIVIPNDPSNGGRALALMAANNLIKLKEGVGVNATVADITDNPKQFEIKEVEAATLPRVLDEVDLALINTNYALEAGLVPTKDALFIEGSDSPYVNILVARPDNKDSDAIQKLAKALRSPDVKKFIEDKYKGSIVPAF